MSKQSEAKERLGYVAKVIPMVCGNCMHYESNKTIVDAYGRVYHGEYKLRCGIGGFAVKKMGTCNAHQYRGACRKANRGPTAMSQPVRNAEELPAVGTPVERPVGWPVPERALPADVARCSGYEMDDGTMAAGCVQCLRRTDRSFSPQQAWMAPCIEVPRVHCPMRIAP